MQPRTFAIVAFALLAGSVLLRYLVVQFGLLPVSEEVVLKKAVAITVTYFDKGQSKSLRISDSEQRGELLAALRIKERDDYYYGWGGTKSGPGQTPAAITFEFSNGMSRRHSLDNFSSLGGFTVDSGFCKKLRTMVANHEGHDVDIFAPGPLIGSVIVPDFGSDEKK